MPGVCTRMFAGDFLEFSDEVGATESIVSFGTRKPIRFTDVPSNPMVSI